MRNNVHKQYDIVLKRMVENDPIGMLRLVGLPGVAAVPFDADLSTVSRQADYLLKVSDPDYLALLEFLTYSDESIERRLILYTALAHHNHNLPVETALVLLKKEADSAKLRGLVQYGSGSLRYRIVRVWEMSKEEALALPVSLLPIAPAANIDKQDLPDVVETMALSFSDAKIGRAREADLWAETFLLLGLKYDEDFARDLLKEVVKTMTESTTYQAILREGKLEGKVEGELTGERRALEIIGARRFGKPSEKVRQELAKITSSKRLDELVERALQVQSWDDLLR